MEKEIFHYLCHIFNDCSRLSTDSVQLTQPHMKNRQRQTNRLRDGQTCMYTLYLNQFMKNTIVGSENVWVRKVLGQKRFRSESSFSFRSERCWVRNFRHSERRPNRWMDERTDGRLASWNFQTNNSSMSRQVGVIKSNVKVQFSYPTKNGCMYVYQI